MAGAGNVSIIGELTGLGQIQDFVKKFTLGTAPTAATYQYRVQGTTNTAESLALGDVSTVYLIMIYAVENELAVDLDFVSAFDSNFSIPEGECAVITKPAGTVKVQNETTDEVCTYEYLILGTT